MLFGPDDGVPTFFHYVTPDCASTYATLAEARRGAEPLPHHLLTPRVRPFDAPPGPTHQRLRRSRGRNWRRVRTVSASEIGKPAPYVPRALLARVVRPLEVLGETVGSTMVFADVSGFTRLSERLARHGKEGAEQLGDLINTCFSALLAEAYARGGSLVKFGGDAMVLMFYDQEGDQQHT